MPEPTWGSTPRRVLLRGGRVYSAADPFATAMLLDGDAVAWLGEDAAAEVYRDVADVVVDLRGNLVTPAFVDAHVHATSTGLALTGLDLTGATSLGAALDLVASYCRSHSGHHVLGHGWDETTWPEGRAPTREELDRASGGAVVYLTRVDVHSAVASSALLASVPGLAALDGYDPDGLLSRAAHHEARAHALASVSAAQRADAQRATRARAAELGIGLLQELAGPDISGEDDAAAFLALSAAEPGPDAVAYWGEIGGVTTATRLGALGAAGDLFVDGALGSRTACLRSPYDDDPDTTGAAYLSAEEIAEHLVACTEAGLQGGFHVIGDGAADRVVAGMRAAAARVGEERFRAARHRLEHVEMLDDDHVAAMADLGVHAGVQPAFDRLWGGDAGMYATRLGTGRAATMNRFADMAARGVALAFGSDAPVTPLDPWGTVRAAAHHHTAAQRLSVRAAFAAHTRGGWRAIGRDDAGVLVPGAPATYAIWAAEDLVVQTPDHRVAAWSTDPRSGTPGLPDLAPDAPLPQCVATVVRGVTVHDRGALEGIPS